MTEANILRATAILAGDFPREDPTDVQDNSTNENSRTPRPKGHGGKHQSKGSEDPQVLRAAALLNAAWATKGDLDAWKKLGFRDIHQAPKDHGGEVTLKVEGPEEMGYNFGAARKFFTDAGFKSQWIEDLEYRKSAESVLYTLRIPSSDYARLLPGSVPVKA